MVLTKYRMIKMKIRTWKEFKRKVFITNREKNEDTEDAEMEKRNVRVGSKIEV